MFDHIWHFWIFARRGARESPIMLKLVSKILIFCVFLNMQKYQKIGLKNLGWSPPLKPKDTLKIAILVLEMGKMR